MLKFFSEVHKSLFMFLQHVTSVCLNKPGVDIALAQERSICSPGAGLVPNPCRSPGAETISGTFLGWRCPPASLLQEQPQGTARPGPGAAVPPARGWCHPPGKGTATALVQPQLGHTAQQCSSFIYTGILEGEKHTINPTYIWLVFYCRIPLCHRNTLAMNCNKCSAHSSLEWRINGFRQSKRSWLREGAENVLRPPLFKEHTHSLRKNG